MNRNTGPAQDEVRAHDSSASPKGWAAVQNYVRGQDDVMIQDCDEDINALLILAGLFSTILTAFLAGSMSWLQEDYTQTTAALLVGLSVQMAEGSSRLGPVQLQPFEADPVDVVINILWFLSLVFSLAAALFGMIVKRWLREYATWQIESPQEALWLRQVRYKAFLQGKVPLIVALLPGLLELALILFMIGIIAMLWTLNSVLALTISVASGALSVIAFSALLLPAFFPRCPYRSPAGWLCVVAWSALRRVTIYCLVVVGHTSRKSYRQLRDKHQEMTDWKDRDMCHSLDFLETHTAKLAHLVDVLSWTHERCQNDHIMDDLRYSFGHSEAHVSHKLRLQLPMYAACRAFAIERDALSASLRSQYRHRSVAGTYGTYTLSLLDVLDVLDLERGRGGVVALEIFGGFLLTEAKYFAALLREPSGTLVTTEDICVFMDALCFMHHVARLSGTSTFTKAYAAFLATLYRESGRYEVEHEFADEHQSKEGTRHRKLPSFRTAVVQILRKLGYVRLAGDSVSVDLEHKYMDFKDYANLAISVFQTNPNYTNAESRHLFVTLSDIAITKCTSWFTYVYNQETLQSLLQCMEAAARVSLDQGIAYCGFYGDLPWVASLSRSAGSDGGLLGCLPLSLLRALEESLDAGLLAGSMRRELEDLLVRCACRDSVVVESPISYTPEAQAAMNPVYRVPVPSRRRDRAPPAVDSFGVDERLSSLDVTLSRPSTRDSPEEGSCHTPLLQTPSSDTLAEDDSSDRSKLSSQKLASPPRDYVRES